MDMGLNLLLSVAGYRRSCFRTADVNNLVISLSARHVHSRSSGSSGVSGSWAVSSGGMASRMRFFVREQMLVARRKVHIVPTGQRLHIV